MAKVISKLAAKLILYLINIFCSIYAFNHKMLQSRLVTDLYKSQNSHVRPEGPLWKWRGPEGRAERWWASGKSDGRVLKWPTQEYNISQITVLHQEVFKLYLLPFTNEKSPHKELLSPGTFQCLVTCKPTQCNVMQCFDGIYLKHSEYIEFLHMFHYLAPPDLQTLMQHYSTSKLWQNDHIATKVAKRVGWWNNSFSNVRKLLQKMPQMQDRICYILLCWLRTWCEVDLLSSM